MLVCRVKQNSAGSHACVQRHLLKAKFGLKEPAVQFLGRPGHNIWYRLQHSCEIDKLR